MELIEKIKLQAKGRFDGSAIEEFLNKFIRLSASSKIIDSILQISTDEGDELEIGFFTPDSIVDITLSNGKVYSYAYPLIKINNIDLSEKESKWVLTIAGEKTFDYNVVKPGSTEPLIKYQASLRQYLSR